MKWIGDFETTGVKRRELDGTSYVWGGGLCEVGNPENVFFFRTIEEFLDWCERRPENDTVFFHNLRFDGNFIIQHLLRNGYKLATTPQEKQSRTFTTLISDKSLWYQIEIYFFIKGKRLKKVTIQDSLKLIPLTVKDIAKSFKLPIKKGSIDYDAHDLLPYGSPLTAEEEDYIKNDVQIVEHALDFFHSHGMNKMTVGACALDEYKRIIGHKQFRRFFPEPFYDADVRKAYKGGFTYLNSKFKGKDLKDLIVLDVNSLYPSVMAGCNGELLPYGNPIFYEGEYVEDTFYPLYIQKISCIFKLKPGKIPMIQIKNSPYYQGNQYLTHSDEEKVDLYLTSVDLKLFFENYDVVDCEFLAGWKFKAARAEVIFGEYVRKWSDIKIRSKEEGNLGMYLIAKLMLNSLYGKFGSATTVQSKNPYLDKDDNMRFELSDPEEKEGIYIGMACFITAYGRDKTIRAAQQITDDYNAGKSDIQFVYADTDSLHLLSPSHTLPEGLEIHETKLGAWDLEAIAVRGKFLRQKCYMEQQVLTEKKYNEALSDEDVIKELYTKKGNSYYYTKITVAGMPESCYVHVTFDNFEIGAIYPGKLSHTTTNGGVVLEEIDYTIKQ